jgi:predicted MFS family arabinose efflux permease
MGKQLMLGFVVMLASIVLLCGAPSVMRFALAVLAFKFSWSYVLPLMLGQLANQDPSGRAMSFSSLAVGGGLAIGPLLGGALIQHFGEYNYLLFASELALMASALLVMSAQRAPYPIVDAPQT